MHSYKVEIFCHFVPLGDIDYLLKFFLSSFNSSYFKGKLCIFNETISIFMKIVLILFDSPFPQCTDKTCFHVF